LKALCVNNHKAFAFACVSFSFYFSLSTNFFDTQKTHEMTHQKQWQLPYMINCQVGKKKCEILLHTCLHFFSFSQRHTQFLNSQVHGTLLEILPLISNPLSYEFSKATKQKGKQDYILL
jgi:hypothetical protein